MSHTFSRLVTSGIYEDTNGCCDILWSSFIVAGDEFFAGDTIGSVSAFDGVSDVEGDVFGLGKRTPSNEIPFTSSFTTSCGSPVDEFSMFLKKEEEHFIGGFKTRFYL